MKHMTHNVIKAFPHTLLLPLPMLLVPKGKHRTLLEGYTNKSSEESLAGRRESRRRATVHTHTRAGSPTLARHSPNCWEIHHHELDVDDDARRQEEINMRNATIFANYINNSNNTSGRWRNTFCAFPKAGKNNNKTAARKTSGRH